MVSLEERSVSRHPPNPIQLAVTFYFQFPRDSERIRMSLLFAGHSSSQSILRIALTRATREEAANLREPSVRTGAK